MRTAKIVQTVYLIVSFIGNIALSSVASAELTSRTLDLDSLPQFSYFGQDNLRRRSTCRLEVEAPGRDFAGRPFQDFQISVDPNQFSAMLKFKGARRQIQSDAAVGAGQIKFKISDGRLELQIISQLSDTLNITEFRLYDRSGMSGAPNLLMECLGVRKIRH